MQRLLLSVVFFAVASCGGHTRNCPQRIELCKCWTHRNSTKIVCDDILSLPDLQSVLEPHFAGQLLSRLHFRGINSASLPPHVLGALTPERFYLSDSNIRRIADTSFRGQETMRLLALNHDRLQEIPTAALVPLTGLQTLALAGNFLTAVQSKTLENQADLQFLILSDNRISRIDRDALPERLQILSLSRNLLGSLNVSLHRLHGLEEVLASGNRLDSVRGEFDGLFNLKRLYLDRNYLRDLSGSFDGLGLLEELSLSENRIRDVGSSLTGLKNLKHLNISFNHIGELKRSAFESLRDLRVLDISGNYLRTVCPALRPLRSLQELSLSRLNLKSLDADCFASTKSLSRLDISYNRLKEVDAVYRYPLSRLTFLDIEFNNLTDIGSNQFQQLRTLRLKGNPWRCSFHLKWTLRHLASERNVNIQGMPQC